MNTNIPKVDVIIIGAGAAGLLCAIEAGKRGRRVVVLEHNATAGKKIRISGGGRCNFTNFKARPDHFISDNPHFVKSALTRYTPNDICALIRAHKIAFHEKKDGQLFCDTTAQVIIDMLLKECARYHVTLRANTNITRITKTELFNVETSNGTLTSESLVVSTGGLSIPPLGATDFGYTIARQFGLRVTSCRPGLVPLTLHAKDLSIFKNLSGVSLPAVVSFGKHTFKENILFTHRGLSGPAILNISSYWEPDKPIIINLLPGKDILALLKNSNTKKTSLKNFLTNFLPARFADVFCAHVLVNKPLNQYSLKELETIAATLNQWPITPKGTEGYAKAEVTVGGIDTRDLSSKTMEVKNTPGLFFIGEVVDVTGQLGGFNFQWAWSSGFAAGQYA